MVTLDDNDIGFELTDDDPYADGYLIQFDDGTEILQRDIEEFEADNGDEYLEISEGETLDRFSFDYSGTNRLWFKIADNNNVFNPFDIPKGTGILIPAEIIKNV